MPHSDQIGRTTRSLDPGGSLSAFSRVMVVMLITLIAAVLIAVSAFRSIGEKLQNAAVTPDGETRTEINPFRP